MKYSLHMLENCYEFPRTGCFIKHYLRTKRKTSFGPDQCGSVGWASCYRVEVRRFNSQSGHVPGLQTRSPVGARSRVQEGAEFKGRPSTKGRENALYWNAGTRVFLSFAQRHSINTYCVLPPFRPFQSVHL